MPATSTQPSYYEDRMSITNAVGGNLSLTNDVTAESYKDVPSNCPAFGTQLGLAGPSRAEAP